MITESIVQAATIRTWLAEAEEQIKGQSDFLTQLDAAIGDGDHGTNMRRGFDAVGKALAGQGDGTPPGRLLIIAGKTLVSTVGGASGPLWGSALRHAGRALGDAGSFGGVAARERPRRGGGWGGGVGRGVAWREDDGRCAHSGDSGAARGARARALTPRCGSRGCGRGLEGCGGDRADAGPQGPRFVPRRAVDRASGSGCYLSRDHPHGARAGRRANELMGELMLSGTPASPGVALGTAWRPDEVSSRRWRRQRPRSGSANAHSARSRRPLEHWMR